MLRRPLAGLFTALDLALYRLDILKLFSLVLEAAWFVILIGYYVENGSSSSYGGLSFFSSSTTWNFLEDDYAGVFLRV